MLSMTLRGQGPRRSACLGTLNEAEKDEDAKRPGGEDGFESPSPSWPDLDFTFDQAWAQGHDPEDLFGLVVQGQPSPPPVHTGAIVDAAEQQTEVHPLSVDDGNEFCIPEETSTPSLGDTGAASAHGSAELGNAGNDDFSPQEVVPRQTQWDISDTESSEEVELEASCPPSFSSGWTELQQYTVPPSFSSGWTELQQYTGPWWSFTVGSVA